MASEKISAMPALGGNQVPTDLVPLVDLSAAPANQNVKSTLNDLFAFVTKNVADRAVRFEAPGSTPALSAAGAGAIYFDGSKFQASENTGAWASLVVAGLITGSGLTQNTARILGRTTAGAGAIEEITVGANLALSAGSLAVTGVALSGLVTGAGLTMNTARLLGRTTAGVGAIEEISIGPGLTLTGGVLDATGGGGGTPGGSQYDVQFHDSGGTFGGSNNFQFKPSGNPTVSIRATSASHNVLDLTADAAQTAEVVLIKQDGDNAASLLTLRQGPLSTLTSSFPFRYENASGTLLLGLRSRPATGLYQFVSPGATNGQVVYEVNALGSNNGLGTASVAGYPAIFAGGIQCVWFNGANGNTIFNQSYQVTWGTNPVSADVGLVRPTAGMLRVSDGSTGGGQLVVGPSSATGSTASLVTVRDMPAANTANQVASFAAIYTAGTVAAGFGGILNFQADTTSGTYNAAGSIRWSWNNATTATRTSQVSFQVADFALGNPERLRLTATETIVPLGRFSIPTTSVTASQGLTFASGGTNYGNFQCQDTGTATFMYYGVNRTWAGTWGATGFLLARAGNLFSMTENDMRFYYFAPGSTGFSLYAFIDRTATSGNTNLQLINGTAGALQQVKTTLVTIGGTNYQILHF